jgi:hypothetical protein
MRQAPVGGQEHGSRSRQAPLAAPRFYAAGVKPGRRQRFLGSLFRRQVVVEQVGEPLDFFFDMVLRLLFGGAAGHQVFFDFDAPVNQCHRFFVELFLLCHDDYPNTFFNQAEMAWTSSKQTECCIA